MNGSRPNSPRQGDRSSLDALNRTIEGLEARIEGLISGTGRDPRSQKGTEYREPAPEARRPAPASQQFSSDPLAEIRERQRMLEASRSNENRGRTERPRAPERREDSRYAEPRRAEIRPPEAYRPQERQPAPRMPETRATETRYVDTRYNAPVRREESRREEPRREDMRREEQRRPAMQARPQAQPSDGGMREIAQALVSLRQDLKQDISEGVAREMNALRDEIRSIRSVAEDQRFADDLRGDLARLAEGINHIGHQATPEAAGLRAEFEELRTVMDGLAREDSVRRMETRWQGLEDRMEDLDSPALREELVALAYRIDDIKSQLGEMSDNPVIRSLEQKLINVAGAMEQIGARMQPNDTVFAEQFATLDNRLDEISRALVAANRASASPAIDSPFMQRLDSRISALTDQIEAMSQANRHRPDQTEALSARIEALTGRMEAMADEQAAMRLEERLEQLSVILEQAQKPVAMQPDLSRHLADISRKIDGLEHGAVNDVLAERLDFLARRIEEIDYSPRVQPAVDEHAFGRIEDRLSDIAARLDEAAVAPRNDEGALRNLEDQIAHLSTLISQPIGGGMSPEFETRMAAIEGYMATNDEYIVEAARQAAEAVVEAYSRNTNAGSPVAAADMAALAGLADDLRHLEDLTRHSEERSHQTFEALHDTLVQIATRLDGMEGRLAAQDHAATQPRYEEPAPREQRRAPAMAAAQPVLHAQREHAAAVYDLDERDLDEQPVASFGTRSQVPDEAIQAVAAQAFADIEHEEQAAAAAPQRQGLLAGLSRRFRPGAKGEAEQAQVKAEGGRKGRSVVDPTPSIDPSDVLPPDHVNDLLEPGSGAPDVKKILERVRASQTGGEFDGDRHGTAAERADYIAAARRAAKAAAQETDPSQVISPAKDMRKAAGKAAPAKASGGKGIGSAIASQRRPILMAVGAVLLFLMAMPLAQKLAGTTTAPQPAAEKIEAPAQPSAPATLGANTIMSAPAAPATDGIGSDLATAPPPARTIPSGSAGDTSTHLTDPRPTAGQPSVMEPAGIAATKPDTFAPAARTVANAPISVPAGIEPKSLADAAASGDPNALFEVGARFTEGRGVKADVSEAANWYKLAADRGLAPAQYRIASLFEKGTGVTRDLNKAVGYYRQAADAGNASAMHNLAVLYASGALGSPDYQAAVSWFGRAADFGVADSQFNLAILFARGNGVKQDLEESYKWFAIAAKDGDKDAAQKRDEVANSMRKEQLESARAKVDLWKVQPLDQRANAVNLPEEWASGKSLTTASIDMEKAIRNVQAILNKNGFDAGAPDGKMGGKTVTAIKAFQKSVGQEPNGKINDALVKELLARNK